MREPFIAASTSLMLLSMAGMASAEDVREPVRGLVRAVDEALISTELSSRIVKITHREGEDFRKGDILVTFDCAKHQAALTAARAEAEFNKIALDNSVELDKRKAIGLFEVKQNRAKYDKARAEVESLQIQVKECEILAPFDGQIAEMRAKAYETSKPNEPLMRLVNTSRLEIELIVPSTWLRWIKPGLKFHIKVDETDTVHDAMVQRIAATVDSVSQTAKIMAVFAEGSRNILPGMSLTAELKQPGP